MQLTKKHLFVFSLLFALPSCAHNWVKSGKTKNDAQIALANCKLEAFKNVKPHYDYDTSSDSECRETTNKKKLECSTTGYNTDLTSFDRSDYVRACMQAQGWQRISS